MGSVGVTRGVTSDQAPIPGSDGAEVSNGRGSRNRSGKTRDDPESDTEPQSAQSSLRVWARGGGFQFTHSVLSAASVVDPISVLGDETKTDRSADRALCLAKYLSMFVGKYRQTYRRLRTRLNRQLHRQMDIEPNLAPYLGLDTSLLGALFKPLFETLFGSLFDSMFV